jgi:hypothetical protein
VSLINRLSSKCSLFCGQRCGKRFYRDYSDSPGMREPQDIYSGDAIADSVLATQAWGNNLENNSQSVLKRLPSANQNLEGEALQDPPNADDLQTENHENMDAPPEVSESWIFLWIPYKGIGKVAHLLVHDQRDDNTLFRAFRQAYFKRRGCCTRFWNLKAVTRVNFGMVSISLHLRGAVKGR